eukprot:3143893-Rhodomonas_salina.2
MSGTGTPCGTINALSAYAMCGTERAYGATRSLRTRRTASMPTRRCATLCAYAVYRMVLRYAYAI